MRSARALAFALPFALGLSVLSGCAKSDPLVGTWEAETQMMGMNGKQTATFGADGTMNMASTFSSPQGTFSLVVTGDWKREEGDKVKMTAKDVQINMDGPQAAQAKAALDGMKPQMIQQFNAEPAQALTWQGNDSFSMSTQGQTVTFKRGGTGAVTQPQ